MRRLWRWLRWHDPNTDAIGTIALLVFLGLMALAAIVCFSAPLWLS